MLQALQHIQKPFEAEEWSAGIHVAERSSGQRMEHDGSVGCCGGNAVELGRPMMQRKKLTNW